MANSPKYYCNWRVTSESAGELIAGGPDTVTDILLFFFFLFVCLFFFMGKALNSHIQANVKSTKYINKTVNLDRIF